MGARLRVFLTQQQDKTLLKLRTAAVPQKVTAHRNSVAVSPMMSASAMHFRLVGGIPEKLATIKKEVCGKLVDSISFNGKFS
jgi:hypothetical protein